MDLTAHSALVDALSRSGDMEAAERILGLACTFAKSQGEPLLALVLERCPSGLCPPVMPHIPPPLPRLSC